MLLKELDVQHERPRHAPVFHLIGDREPVYHGVGAGGEPLFVDVQVGRFPVESDGGICDRLFPQAERPPASGGEVRHDVPCRGVAVLPLAAAGLSHLPLGLTDDLQDAGQVLGAAGGEVERFVHAAKIAKTSEIGCLQTVSGSRYPARQQPQQSGCEEFGGRHRQPDADDAQQAREREEAERHEHDAPQYSEAGCEASPLDALEIADRHDVDAEKGIPRGEPSQPLHSNRVGGGFGQQEKACDPGPEQPGESEHGQSAAEGGEQRHAQGHAAAAAKPRAVVVADDGLRRLQDTVIDHEYDGEEVAGDAEGRHPVLADIADESVVSDHHQA